MEGLRQSAQTSEYVGASGVEIRDRGLLNSTGDI
jgi:hypothetical protein